MPMTAAASQPVQASIPAVGREHESVDRWFLTADPGAQVVYYSGAFLPRHDPAVRAARRLIDMGLVLPFQVRRGPALFDYCLTRRRNADAPVSRGRVQVERQGVEDEARQLLAVLRRLANMGQPCPTNSVLADKAQLKDADAVRYRLKQLETAGDIRVTWSSDSIRVVRICASGRCTSRSSN